MKTFLEYLTEQERRAYTEWGWINPKGKYFDGMRDPHANEHEDWLPVISYHTTYRQAYAAGWIRFYDEELSDVSGFECINNPATLKRLRNFIQRDPQKVMHRLVSFDIWDKKQNDFAAEIYRKSRAEACTLIQSLLDKPQA